MSRENAPGPELRGNPPAGAPSSCAAGVPEAGVSPPENASPPSADDLLLENSRLRERLRNAEAELAAKDSFLSSMSHDIRTPMNAIVGMTALAKKHIDEKARVSDALGKIEVASAHLLDLINEVLDISRLNSDRMQLEDAPFSLSDLLHDTLVLTRPLAVNRGHRFQFSAGGILYEELYGDAMRLRQIYVNIISNAVKYTPDGGEIAASVSEEAAGDRIVLCFLCRDNGIGMSKEFLDHIFTPFARADSASVSRIEGTGLGMSIVKKLIDTMEGEIRIASEPGKGTSVSVRIPLRYETLPVDKGALRDIRLLIVEPDPALASQYRQYLGEAGVEFSLTSSPSEAIGAITDASFRGGKFDGILLGSLKGSAGTVFDAASYFRKTDASLPLILVSEDDWSAIEYRANRSGIEYFIPVPFFRKSLINALNEIFHREEAPERSTSAPDLTGRRILLAEDNFINREIACELLSVTNAAVDTAENGKEALDAFLASPPGSYDLILMDIQMPVMDGYAAVRSIRSSGREDAETVPVFAMTANVFAEDVSRAREAGMNGHIAKPIDVNKLMQILKGIR